MGDGLPQEGHRQTSVCKSVAKSEDYTPACTCWAKKEHIDTVYSHLSVVY